VIVCFGWPEDAKPPILGQASVAKFDTSSTTYSVVVPNLEPAPMSWTYRTGLGMVPLATMRIIAYGGAAATPAIEVVYHIGITNPLLALLLAVLAVAIALWVFYVFARNRGVPGKGLVLWMISTRNGVASLSQAQIMLWTFLIGALAIYVMALSGALIDIADSTLVLLGIAGLATIGSKLQNSQQDAKGATQADGQTALPGKVPSVQAVGDATTDSEVRLAWAPPTTGGPVMGYIVEYQPTAAGTPANPVWNAVGETIVLPHHTVLGLAPATNYQFRVRAANTGGLGEPSEIGPIQTQARAATPAGAPGPTGGLRVAGPPTQTSVLLAWSPADGAPTGYSVQYRRHDHVEAWATAPQPATQPQFTVNGLVSGVAYDFRVAAVNAVGQGLCFNVVTARTLRDPEWADLVVTGDGRGEIDVTRAQMLFFTMVAALFVGMKVLSSYVIPDIPQGILLLMGISNGVYMTSKFIPD
jgi:Fibronectin type III domain